MEFEAAAWLGARWQTTTTRDGRHDDGRQLICWQASELASGLAARLALGRAGRAIMSGFRLWLYFHWLAGW